MYYSRLLEITRGKAPVQHPLPVVEEKESLVILFFLFFKGT